MTKSILLSLSISALALGGVSASLAQKPTNRFLEVQAGIAESTTYKIDVSNVTEWVGETSFNLYAFDDDDNVLNGEWPGNAIPAANISENVITITAPVGTKAFIINDGSLQTVDIFPRSFSDATFICSDSKSDGKVDGIWDSNGWYVTGTFTGWTASASYQTTNPSGTNNGQWNNVVIPEGGNFKVAYYNNYGFANDSWKGYSVLNSNPYFEVGDDDNIVATYGGTYNIVLTDAYAITVSPADDVTAVDNFVAKYITEQSKESYAGKTAEQRAIDCATKYSAASGAYIALSSSQKTLFATGKAYESAYAAYLTWEASGAGSTAWRRKEYLPQ